jgi:hypothetical protein
MINEIRELNSGELDSVSGGGAGEIAAGVGAVALGFFGGPVALATLVTAEAVGIAAYGPWNDGKKLPV